MEVKAEPMNRRPRTATFPVVTVKLAEPRLPTIALNPGRSLSTASVLLFAGRNTLEVPIVAPSLSRRTIDTVVAILLGFTIATAVTKLVSSHVRVLVVLEVLASGTTAS